MTVLDLPPVEPVEPDTMVKEVMKLTSRLDALTAELTKVQKALTGLCEKVQATSSEAEASRTLFICRACDATTTGRTDSSFDTPGWRRLDGLDGPDAICPRCVADPTALTWLRDDYPDVRLRPEPSPQPAIPVVAGWVVKNNAPNDQKPFLGRIGWSDTPIKAGPFTDRASANSEAKARTYANLTVLPVDADGAVIEERAKLPVPTPWNRWLADALRHQANVDDGSGTTGPRQEASTRFARFCRHLADKVLSEGADAFDWPPTPSELEMEHLTRERDAALALARRCREVALGERERIAEALCGIYGTGHAARGAVMARVSAEARTLLLADAKAGCSVEPSDAIDLLADLADAEALVERLKEQIERTKEQPQVSEASSTRPSTGTDLIQQERARQVSEKGYDEDHDDE